MPLGFCWSSWNADKAQYRWILVSFPQLSNTPVKQLSPCAAQCEISPPVSGEGSCCPTEQIVSPLQCSATSTAEADLFDSLAPTLPSSDGYLWEEPWEEPRECHSCRQSVENTCLVLCSNMTLHQAEGNLAFSSWTAYLTVNIRGELQRQAFPLWHKSLLPSVVLWCMATVSSPSNPCDRSLTPGISLNLCPLRPIGKTKGKRIVGKWRKRVCWGRSPAHGPAPSTSLFSLPSLPLCEPREMLILPFTRTFRPNKPG